MYELSFTLTIDNIDDLELVASYTIKLALVEVPGGAAIHRERELFAKESRARIIRKRKIAQVVAVTSGLITFSLFWLRADQRETTPLIA